MTATILNRRARRFLGATSMLAAAFCLLTGASSCGSGNKGNDSALPDNFNSIGDNGRVGYMMKNVTPDSLARFMCDAALGRLKWARIDSLASATLYVYENYHDEEAAGRFSEEFERYSSSLPLEEKMRIYLLSGKSDANSLGYDLGLEYVNYIREHNIGAEQAEKEIAAFRTRCADDPDTYRRFVKGFRVVLEADRGHDLPEEIYNKFSTLEAD